MPTNLTRFMKCPEQPRKTFSLQNIKHKKEKRNKSGLHIQLYSSLTAEEQEKVKESMKAYNAIYGDQAFFEVEQYYQQVYRQIIRLRRGVNVL